MGRRHSTREELPRPTYNVDGSLAHAQASYPMSPASCGDADTLLRQLPAATLDLGPRGARACPDAERHIAAEAPEEWRQSLQVLQRKYAEVLRRIDDRTAERSAVLRSQLERSRSYDMPPS